MSALTVPTRSALLVPSPLAPSTSQPSDFGLQYPDLTAPLGAYNVAGFTYTITSVGADVYELTITGTGVVADGPTEGLVLDFEVTDVDGATVALSNGTHDVLSIVTIENTLPGGAIIVAGGIRTRGGATPHASAFYCMAGFGTGGTREVITAASSNGSTAQGTIDATELQVRPSLLQPTTAWAAGSVTTYSTSAALSSTSTSHGSDATPGTTRCALFIGCDSTDTTQRVVRFKWGVRLTPRS